MFEFLRRPCLRAFEAVRTRLLRFLRVPHEPEPPFGAPGSVRVFRAGTNYNRILLVRWGLTQITAFIGLLVGMFFVAQLFDQVEIARRTPPPKPAAPVTPPQVGSAPATAPPLDDKNAKRVKRARRDDAFVSNAVARTPGWVFTLILLFEGVGILIFAGQFLVTFIAVRLEYEQHWYIVTDRSLRIRTGLFRVQESTMSFANLQQVVVSQGPLQRLLGLADVQVQSAGGGGADEHKPGADTSLHTGIFHSVANAPEIRDLILDRLRQFRATGLGDPDETTSSVGGVPPPRLASAPAPASDALLAARELLAEAAALRRTLAG